MIADALEAFPAELTEALIESRWANALACADRLVDVALLIGMRVRAAVPTA
jgi:hypothetical protein